MTLLAMTDTPNDTPTGSFKRTDHGWEPNGWDPAENEALALLSGTEPVDVQRILRHLTAWEERGAPIDVLTEATTISTNPDERRDLAQETTDPATLTHLALSKEKLVRQRVASNDATPHWVINGFATDKDVRTRRGAATHPTLDATNAEYLAHDNSWEVRARIAGREDLAESLILYLADDTDNQGRVIERLATNKATPDAVLVALASSGKRNVERRLIRRADLPEEALELLAQGASPVAAEAKSKLATKRGGKKKQRLPGLEFAILDELVEKTEYAVDAKHWDSADQVRIVLSAHAVPAIRSAMDHRSCSRAYHEAVKAGEITPLDYRFIHLSADIGAELLYDAAAVRLGEKGWIDVDMNAKGLAILGFTDEEQYAKARAAVGR